MSDMREAFRKYAVDNGLLHMGKDNLATCVQNLEKHQRDFNAGYQAQSERIQTLHSLLVEASGMMRRIEDFSDSEMQDGDAARIVAGILRARINAVLEKE